MESFDMVFWVVATQIFFIFIPILGEMIQFDEQIFQMGWFNHQAVLKTSKSCTSPSRHSMGP